MIYIVAISVSRVHIFELSHFFLLNRTELPVLKRVCVCGGCREWISPKAQSFHILVVVLRELIVVLSANGEGV